MIKYLILPAIEDMDLTGMHIRPERCLYAFNI